MPAGKGGEMRDALVFPKRRKTPMPGWDMLEKHQCGASNG